MEKPSRKLKKTLLILGVTGAVYACFKYMLPLVIPFLIAYVFALILRPSAMWLRKKCCFTIKGKKICISLAIIGGVEIFLFVVILGALVYVGGRKLFVEASLLFNSLPRMIDGMDQWLTRNCVWIEQFFHMPDGYMVDIVRDILVEGGKAIKNTTMSFLMVNSMTVVKWFVQITVFTVILFIATILSLQEMEDIRMRRDNSMFRHEFAMISNRLITVGSAWLKTQGMIMILTMIICTAGLFLMGSPYSILLGIGIGLLDALPIFGTGTVLIPWTLFSFINGKWLFGFGILAIYIICYFLREIMEAKIMSSKVGLTPLESLISMYLGLQLFGILGLLMGPIGLLIIEDVVEFYEAA